MTISRADLEALKRAHYTCEDGWYSCPLSKEGCYDDRQDECNCGASKHNAKVDALIHSLQPETAKSTMTSPDPRPLWKLMLHMRVPATPWHELKATEDEQEEIAAEIRAIADEIERRDIDPLEIEDWLREEALNAEEGNE